MSYQLMHSTLCWHTWASAGEHTLALLSANYTAAKETQTGVCAMIPLCEGTFSQYQLVLVSQSTTDTFKDIQ